MFVKHVRLTSCGDLHITIPACLQYLDVDKTNGTAKITAYFGEKGKPGTLKVSANLSVKAPLFAKTDYSLQTGAKLTISKKNVNGSSNAGSVTWNDGFAKILSSGSGNGYSNEPLSGYYVYDIDKDGIPELILDFGEIEASKHGIILKYDTDKNAVIKVGEVATGDSCFYTYPNGNGILWEVAGMGEQTVYRLSLQNNTIKKEQIYYNYDESPDSEYTDIGKIVSGSEYIEGYASRDTSGITNYK